MNVEVPRTLPGVEHLSHSSVRMYLRCPLKWHNRYILNEYEPTNANMLIGKSVGSGVSAGYIGKMVQRSLAEDGLSGAPGMRELMLDIASDTFDEAVKDEEIDWGEEHPQLAAGRAKDTAIICTEVYHDDVAVKFEPETVEEGFEIQFPDADWAIKGYIDFVGEAQGLLAELHDLKVVGKADNGIDSDPQATLYIASRYARDGSLPSFAWHQVKKPTARTPASATLMTTQRTPVQINNYLERIAQVAREIEWRYKSGDWQGAVPGSWWCSQKFCGYYETCPFGGAK